MIGEWVRAGDFEVVFNSNASASRNCGAKAAWVPGARYGPDGAHYGPDHFGCACECTTVVSTTRPHLQGVLGWAAESVHRDKLSYDVKRNWDADRPSH